MEVYATEGGYNNERATVYIANILTAPGGNIVFEYTKTINYCNKSPGKSLLCTWTADNANEMSFNQFMTELMASCST